MFRKCAAIALIGALFVTANPAFAERLDWRQHKELFVEGTITDSQGRTWRIKIVPGIHRIDRRALKGWIGAGKLIDDLWDGKFYSNTVYRKGLRADFRVAGKSASSFWFKGLGRDWVAMRAESAQFRSGDFGKTFFKTWSGIKFGLKALGRTAAAPIGIGGGTAYGVVAPVALVASRPVGAGIQATFPGAAVPAVLYVWNGTAWVATYFSSVPERQNVWVHLQTREKEFVIDGEGFKSMLQGTVLSTLSKAETQAIEAHIKSLSDQIRTSREDVARLRADLSQLSAYQAMQSVIGRARAAEHTQLDSDPKSVFLNDDALHSLVHRYLEEIGVPSSTAAQTDAIVRDLKENIESLLRH